MPSYSQDGQPLAIETPLGKDQLLLEAVEGEEALGDLFVFRLDCLSVAETLSDTAIVGKQVSFRVNDASNSPRWFTGYVSRFSWMGRDDLLTRWRVEVVPSLWFASLTTDCRIFQEKSVPDIVGAVLGETSEVSLSKKISGSHAPWEYCVQYRETDFAFVSRLMEHEGISYHFEHSQGALKMVVSDANSAFTDCKNAEVETAQGFGAPATAGVITNWRHEYAFRPGKVVQNDYSFSDPAASLLSTGNGKSTYAGSAKAELFEYPGFYDKKPAGDETAKVRIEAEEAAASVASGKSTCRSFSPGYTFKVKSHPNSAERGKKYLLTKVAHRANIRGAYEASSGGGAAFEYENSFEAVPADAVWRPVRKTPWPAGTIQTALVVGPSGEEIYTDKYGRIKVQFHWDRYGKKNEQSSCWIRVSQSLAGPQFGMQFIPRLGMEVVVSHLDDDPNRPLVTGVVYNGTNKPPFDLPSKAAQSGLQTRSTKDGAVGNASQLIFDDTKGAEMVTLHAEKNFKRTVENDDTLEIGFVAKDKGDRSVKVYNNLTEEIGASGCSAGNRTLTVYKDNTTTVSTGNEKHTVSKGDAAFDVTQGNHTVTVGGKQSNTVGKGHSLVVSSGSHSVEVSSGSGTMKAMSWTIEGQTGITLKVGSNSIEIGPAGVTITGLTVSVKGTTSTQVEGLQTTIKGTAMLQAQGAITMIG
jgi:type VI secretion system secreted protein VgrG